MTTDIEQLHAALLGRDQPETVATVVIRVLNDKLDRNERKILSAASRRAERWPWYFSSMANQWEQPVDATNTTEYVASAFAGIADDLVQPDQLPKPDDVAGLRHWHDALAGRCGYQPAAPGRVSHEKLAATGLDISTRRWRRALHALDMLGEKTDRLARMQQRLHFARSARLGMGDNITIEQVRHDPDAAAFCAYMVAKRNLRRGFSLDGRDNPYDEIADMLFKRLGDDSDWWMVALVYPTTPVVAHLDDEHQGQLIAHCWTEMSDAAALCGQINTACPVNRDTMVVHQGNDSDTWNLTAGAYNTNRLHWLSVLTAADQLALTTAVLPPKLPRLMAGDLIFWHVAAGNAKTHPDVLVAALLPPAWEVLAGTATCTLQDVHQACAQVEIDPDTTGWSAPFAHTSVGRYEPTPEMVHGITVGDPILASMLRRAHAWSGQDIRPEHLPPDELWEDVRRNI